MYSVDYSGSNNRIYIRINGVLDGTEIQSYINDVINAINNTEPGFTVCANLTEAAVSVLENSANFQCVRDYACSKSLACAVTVLSPELNRLHMQSPFQGIAKVCTSMDAAEEILNNITTGGKKCTK